jgi:hypothetical protein
MLCRYTGPAIASRSNVLKANGAIIMHASALPQQMGGRPAFPILWAQGTKDPLYVRVPSPSAKLMRSVGQKHVVSAVAHAASCTAQPVLLLCAVPAVPRIGLVGLRQPAVREAKGLHHN